MKTVTVNKTTKIFENTLRDVKRLSADDLEGANQAQIIARAVLMYAESKGYIYTANGLVCVGDKVLVNGDELVIKTIVGNKIIFTDLTSIEKGSGLAWRMERVEND